MQRLATSASSPIDAHNTSPAWPPRSGVRAMAVVHLPYELVLVPRNGQLLGE